MLSFSTISYWKIRIWISRRKIKIING
jgi:hypothetical protein